MVGAHCRQDVSIQLQGSCWVNVPEITPECDLFSSDWTWHINKSPDSFFSKDSSCTRRIPCVWIFLAKQTSGTSLYVQQHLLNISLWIVFRYVRINLIRNPLLLTGYIKRWALFNPHLMVKITVEKWFKLPYVLLETKTVKILDILHWKCPIGGYKLMGNTPVVLFPHHLLFFADSLFREVSIGR